MPFDFTPPPQFEQPLQERPAQERPIQETPVSSTALDLLQEQTVNGRSESNSDSTSVNSASQSNIQVNNNSNRIEYGSFKVPETSLYLNGYFNDGAHRDSDFGVIVGLNVPIGGSSRKSINRAIDIQFARDEIAYEAEYASACANIEDGGS